MTIKASTLRPGLLVSLKTSVSGNVSYKRLDLEKDHSTEDGARLARWETERKITDPVEHEAAETIRASASNLIRSVCAKSAFGLLCPEDAADKLDEAIRQASELANAFNGTAKLTRVSVYVIAGRIAQDDVSAVRAINSEISDLMNVMQEGIRNLDTKAIRDAASKAKSVGMMLSPAMQERVQTAIDTARTTARAITKAGEQAAVEVDRIAIRKIAEQRTAFLDLDEEREMSAPSDTGRAIDMTPEASEYAMPSVKFNLDQ